jgi:hypothetical protein
MSKRKYMLVDEGEVTEQVDDLVWPDGDPVVLGDFGQRLSMAGILWQGEGHEVLILGPNASESNFIRQYPSGFPDYYYPFQPDLELWCRIILQTDDPVIFEEGQDRLIKAIHRKMQFQISSGVRWAIWERDGFRCMFCNKKGGAGVPLSIDHFIPLEKGGLDNAENYLTACRYCAKLKGSKDPEKFCKEQDYDYKGLRLYLQGKAPRSFIAHLA